MRGALAQLRERLLPLASGRRRAIVEPASSARRREAPAAVADPRAGTAVALGYPLLLVAGIVLWAGSADHALGVPVVAAGGLIALAFACGRISVGFGPRSFYCFETPLVIVAALAGGPLVGAIVGVAANTTGVWRRRLAYGGLGGLQGLLVGMIPATLPATASHAQLLLVGCLAALAASFAGRTLIQADRRIYDLGRLLRGTGAEILELTLWFPLLLALLYVFPAQPLLGTLALASTFAGVAAVSLVQRRDRTAVAELRRLATSDYLTGTANRAAIVAACQREHADILRGGLPAGILMIDIDNFRSFNEQHRMHRVGDEMLVGISSQLQDALRPSDTLARWAGDEFCVLCREIDLDELTDLAQRLRAAIADATFSTTAGPQTATISVGGTLLDGATTPEQARHRADEALYRAKHDRNQIVLEPPPRSHAARAAHAVASTG